MQKNIETFLGCEDDFSESRIVIFGAPFDSTTSYRPGARFASRHMRAESYGLETYSPYQGLDLEDARIFDSGDLELPFGDAGAALNDITDRTREILASDKLPFMIGGEHLVTLGAVRAVAEKYDELYIIHFDAHADLRDDYLGTKLSHACVLRRCWEIVGDDHIFQFGIRSGDRAELEWGREHVKTRLFDFEGLPELVKRLKGKNVYLTIDLDVLDPSVFPGTGTPEAGGVTFRELLDAVLMVSRVNIVGMDINELAPMLDASGASTAVALKIMRELMLAVYFKKAEDK